LQEAEAVATEADDAVTAANAAILRLFLLEKTDPKRQTVDVVAEA
jgi:hypothetical protein